MSSPEAVTRRAFLLGPVLLAACGFVPAHAPGGPGSRFRGRVSLEVPDTPDGFRLRAALADRLGPAGAATATLSATPTVEEVVTASDSTNDASRSVLRGRATWLLLDTSGAVLDEGEVSAFTGKSQTGSLVAQRAAADDARERLMTLLADRIVSELLLLPPEALP